jgi:hypothetical protein
MSQAHVRHLLTDPSINVGLQQSLVPPPTDLTYRFYSRIYGGKARLNRSDLSGQRRFRRAAVGRLVERHRDRGRRVRISVDAKHRGFGKRSQGATCRVTADASSIHVRPALFHRHEPGEPLRLSSQKISCRERSHGARHTPLDANTSSVKSQAYSRSCISLVLDVMQSLHAGQAESISTRWWTAMPESAKGRGSECDRASSRAVGQSLQNVGNEREPAQCEPHKSMHIRSAGLAYGSATSRTPVERANLQTRERRCHETRSIFRLNSDAEWAQGSPPTIAGHEDGNQTGSTTLGATTSTSLYRRLVSERINGAPR